MKRFIGLLSAIPLILAGCSKMPEATASPKTSTVLVSVHGVNYTANPFRFVLVDAKNPANGTGGGEHISPFGGGRHFLLPCTSRTLEAGHSGEGSFYPLVTKNCPRQFA